MSNLSAIGLIMAIYIPGYLLATYVIRGIQDDGDLIASGTRDGAAMSPRYRWITLFHGAIPRMVFLVAFLLIATLAYWNIASIVDDGRVRLLSYAAATVSGGAALSVVPGGIIWVVHMAAEVRKAAADATDT